jgi:RluA family pseudouridine synthase
MNPERKKSFTSKRYLVSHPVRPEDEGLRLDSFVHLHMPTLSREFLKQKIIQGDVSISGRTSPHKPSVKVHAGEEVSIVTYFSPFLEDEHWYGKPIELIENPVTIFEDEDLIVCMKPPFMITHPAGKHLFYCATVFYGSLLNKVMHSIHRLDRETSGLLLLGKNPQVSQKISSQFEHDQVRKCYFLIAKKTPQSKPFPFTAHESMDRDETKIPRGKMWVNPHGKEAETHFELLKDLGDYVLVLAFPMTGRQHQIRLHAAHHGYPLLGDKMYGEDSGIFIRFKDGNPTVNDHEYLEIPRQALHALAIKLNYPEEVKKVFRAPLPKDLNDWLQKKFPQVFQELNQLIENKLKDF